MSIRFMHQRRDQLFKLFVVSLLCCTCASSTLFSAEGTKENGMKKITSIEGITEYELENGLKVLLFPDHSKPTVTINLTIFVGSRHEGYGEAGMAHLLEHMLFKGTPTHPKVPKVLQERGARFNGTTWLDRTNYYETLPASDSNLEFAIRLEADRMVNSYVKGEDLKSEMTVVRNEFERGENSPSRVLSQRMMSTAYEWHNYGKSTIGNRADIERVPIKNLKRFYKKHYQTDNAMLVVAGKFDDAKAKEYINKYFGALKKTSRKLDQTYTEEPAQDGERMVTLRRVGEVAIVGALYHIPSGAHPDYVAIDVLESILTSSPSGRLYKGLVVTKRATSISGAAYGLHDPGILKFMAEVSKGNEPHVVLETMLELLDTVRSKGVTKDELERAKRKLLKQRELAASNSSRIAVELSEWGAMGDWRLYFLYRDRLEKITIEDVNHVAKKYLTQNNRTVGLYVPTEKPDRADVPATPDLAKMIGDYKGRKVVSSGEAFDVTPNKIEARTKRSRLPSGIQVATLEKKTRGDMVLLQLVLRFGNRKNLHGLSRATSFLGPMLMRGTTKHSRQQLQDELDKLQARLNVSSSAGAVTFGVQCKKENLAAVLKLMEEVMRHPTFPEDELSILKRASVASREQQLKDPQALAVAAARRKISIYPKGDPLYQSTIQESITEINAVSIDTIKKIYKNYLGGHHGELVVVGDFKTDEVTSTIEKIISGWDAKEPYAHIAAKADANSPGSTEDILTPGKANATYFATLAFPMRDDHSDYPALVIGNFILGGGSLSSRLGDRVRQKEGLSYGVGSGFNASSLDLRSAFYLYAITNPKNMPKVKTVILEELDKLLKDGVTEKELSQAKQGYLQKAQVSRSRDSTLAGLLLTTLRANRTMLHTTKLEKAIQDLTTEQVLAALKKHIKKERLHIVAAGDLKK